MKVVSIINYKGGVGKTTVTANLGAELARLGKAVLLIDLDPQANLTFSFFKLDYWRRELEERRTIKNWYDAYIDSDLALNLAQLIAHPTQIAGAVKGKLDVVCSHLELINVDIELASKLSGTERVYRNNYLQLLRRLHRGVQGLDQDAYDVVLIDCPPNFGVITQTAIAASNFLLLPTKADYLSTLGITQLSKHVDELVAKFNRYVDEVSNAECHRISPQVLGVLFTMISLYRDEPVSTLRQYIDQMKRQKVPCLHTQLRENKTLFGSAGDVGIPVVLQDVGSQKTYVDVVNELRALAQEVLQKMEAV